MNMEMAASTAVINVMIQPFLVTCLMVAVFLAVRMATMVLNVQLAVLVIVRTAYVYNKLVTVLTGVMVGSMEPSVINLVQCYSTCEDKCDQISGDCLGCLEGRFGPNCTEPCSGTCSGPCEQVDGVCKGCYPGRYGPNCDKICPSDCTEGMCDQQSGKCTVSTTTVEPSTGNQ